MGAPPVALNMTTTEFDLGAGAETAAISFSPPVDNPDVEGALSDDITFSLLGEAMSPHPTSDVKSTMVNLRIIPFQHNSILLTNMIQNF
mmetsp:Transcript_42453/g.81134  ORF Transcript_42453/g.81134 Transcript_42453/m.81134 type:complete len:89 (+) Transcript_42453:307-573(+)